MVNNDMGFFIDGIQVGRVKHYERVVYPIECLPDGLFRCFSPGGALTTVDLVDVHEIAVITPERSQSITYGGGAAEQQQIIGMKWEVRDDAAVLRLCLVDIPIVPSRVGRDMCSEFVDFMERKDGCNWTSDIDVPR